MYIKKSVCISPQRTFPSGFQQDALVRHNGTRYFAAEPAYEGLIPPGSLRRMGRASRMGVGAGLQLLTESADIDGILIGTANGGLEDCIRFLNQIVDYQEGTLTPTNFVQSTPNAIAGQLALSQEITGYNITHVHGGIAFENTLTDALMLFSQGQAKRLLVGGVEEISDYNHNIDRLSGFFKTEDTNSATLLDSQTPGSVNGEGATMFLMEKERSESSQVQVLDVRTLSFVGEKEVFEVLEALLDMHHMDTGDLDSLVLGYNGDPAATGEYNSFLDRFDRRINLLSYKNACGEYQTASAFALWLSQQYLTRQPVPQELVLRKSGGIPENLLIYNQFRGYLHSLILVRKV